MLDFRFSFVYLVFASAFLFVFETDCMYCLLQRMALFLYCAVLGFGFLKKFKKKYCTILMGVLSGFGALVAFLQIANEFFQRMEFWHDPNLPGGRFLWILKALPFYSLGMFVVLYCFAGYVLKKENSKWQ